MPRLSSTRVAATLIFLAVTAHGARAGAPSLDQLVAPIALYPDPLIAQVLPASTNPLEVFEAADAVANGARPSQETAAKWDPSIQALLSFPTVLKMMRDKIDWTTQLGKAFVADQGGVLAAIQHVRQQAQKAGNLKTNDKQVVTAQGSTIVIEPASPQVIYVPQYDPVAVLAPPPPYYAYAAYAPLMTFGVGFAAGAATAYACSWGSSSVVVNNNYHYSYTNNYNGYHSYSSSSGSYGAYHPQSGAYTGYNAHTGTYGAYNPATGKYGTYNPSTGQYNKDGQTGTYKPPSETSSSGGSSGEHHQNGVDTGYNSKTGTYGAYNPNTGKYGTYNPSTGAYNKDGQTGTYKPPSSSSTGSSLGSTSSGGHHYGSSSAWGDHSSWGSGGGGSGGDAFHGVGGGGWGAREASDRGSQSLGGSERGGGGFGGGGFDRGGGGGGFGGYRGGGFRGRR